MKPISITWHCIDPTKNKARWYSLTNGIDLWGNQTIIKRYGRLGQRGHERIEWLRTTKDFTTTIEQTHKQRRRHGYRLVVGHP